MQTDVPVRERQTSMARSGRGSRRVLMAILSLALLAAGARMVDWRVLPINDFMEYWAAASLQLSGGNPYSQAAMYELERGVGLKSEKPLMMWNPPWVLPFVLPFGLVSLGAGRALMFAATFVILFSCADALWRYYGGSPRRRWLAALLTCTFAPALVCLSSGQLSAFMLLGIVSFLLLQHRNLDVAAGASLLLAGFKPHFVFLLFVSVAVWAVWQRRPRILLGAALGFGTAIAIAVYVDPLVFARYREALRSESMLALYAPPLGGWLRVGFGWTRYWLQFVPAVAGLCWYAWWQRHHGAIDWKRDLSLIVAVSACTAAYGWVFDQVVLLTGLMRRAAEIDNGEARPSALPLCIYAGANTAVILLMATGHSMLSSAYGWTAPVWLYLYVTTGQQLREIDARQRAQAKGVKI